MILQTKYINSPTSVSDHFAKLYNGIKQGALKKRICETGGSNPTPVALQWVLMRQECYSHSVDVKSHPPNCSQLEVFIETIPCAALL